MMIPMLQHSATALGGQSLPKCTSRSLFAARFANPSAKDGATQTLRKDWFHRLIAISAENVSRCEWLPKSSLVVHARLMSRMMVDLAGGVMENANLNLDRYGLPRIPGSAVKGCARRMALQALRDWGGGTDDLSAPCREGFESPAIMLAATARIFGWVESDWSSEKNRDKKTNEETTWKSDFAWAVQGNVETLKAARELLPDVPSYAGAISFLAAWPNRDPGLELDVVTPHHTDYYQRKPGYVNATDTEEPVPVFFPTIKTQTDSDFFSFPLIRLSRASVADLQVASRFLAHGLEIFGLGAKTNAGYGWFAPIQNGIATDPLSKLLPPASQAEIMLKNWKSRALNSMSAKGFIKEASELSEDEDLIRVFRALAGNHLESISSRERFWLPFFQIPAGKALIGRLKNAMSTNP